MRLRRIAVPVFLACLAAAGCRRKKESSACTSGALAPVHPAVRLDTTAPAREARIAVVGTTFLAVWSSGSASNADLWARLVDGNGVLRSNEVRLTNIASAKQHPRLALGAAGLALSWTDDRDGRFDAFAAVVGTAFGPVLGHAFVAPAFTTTQQPLPTVASLGTGFVVVWNAPGGDGNDHLWAQQMGTDGAPFGAAAPLVSGFLDRPLTGFDVEGPEAASLGVGVAIVDAEDRLGATTPPDVWAYLVNGTGGVASQRFAPTAPATFPSVAADALGDVLVTWCDARSGADQIFVGALGPGGLALNERAISGAAPACPATVAAGEGFFLLAWDESSPNGTAVAFETVSATGLPDRAGRVVSGGHDVSGRPDVAWNGHAAGVTWVGANGLWFQPLECTLGAFPSPTPSASP